MFQIKVSTEPLSFLELRVLFQAHMVIGRKQFLVVLRLWSVPSRQSAGACTQLLRVPTVPVMWQLAF